MYYKIIIHRDCDVSSYDSDAIKFNIVSDKFKISLNVHDFVSNYRDAYHLFDEYFIIDTEVISNSLKSYIDNNIVPVYGNMYTVSNKSMYKIVHDVYGDKRDERGYYIRGIIITRYDMKCYSFRYARYYMINKIKDVVKRIFRI